MSQATVTRARSAAHDATPIAMIEVPRRAAGGPNHWPSAGSSLAASPAPPSGGGWIGQPANPRPEQAREREQLVSDLHARLAGPLLRALYTVRRIEALPDVQGAPVAGDLAMLETMLLEAQGLLGSYLTGAPPVIVMPVPLTAAIRMLVDRFVRETDLTLRLRLMGDLDRLDGELSNLVLRSAEIALQGVAGEATATSATLSVICRSGRIAVRVEDDRRELLGDERISSEERRSLGELRTRIAARGGVMRIGPGRRSGRRVRVQLPERHP